MSTRTRSRRPVRTMLRLEALEERTVPALLGNQLFPADNPWNQNIGTAPVAANSAAIINNIVDQYGDGRLHPDFGQVYGGGDDLYGIPYNVVHGNSTPTVSVVIDAYADESDVTPAPVPDGAVLEGDYQNGPRLGVDERGDSHLLVYDVDNNIAYEFYRASRPGENDDGQWHADQQSVWDMNTNTFRTLGWTSADAAGLSILAGLARPDEGLPENEGGQGVINHAIRVTLKNNIILDQYVYPASHIANSNTHPAYQPPMGARLRLKADVDIAGLNPQSRVIAQAMKDYGLIVADNGSNFFFSGASAAVDGGNHQVLTWNDDDIQDTSAGLKSLHFSDFEVVDLRPAVTGLDVHNGLAGTEVAVTGQNFGGAASQFQVLFGTTPAAGVTLVDDSHLVAVAPEGAGTVDVRVQAGVTVDDDPQNFTSPVLGYGISAVTARDRFTYGTSTSAPPTVARPARALPGTVVGTTTRLSVLGADDGGATELLYEWSATGPAVVTFSLNGSLAARKTVAVFGQVGAYTLTATITDADGLSVTSAVNVVVQPKFTSIAITPATATLTFGEVGEFTATALDQFGAALATQPTFRWTLRGGGAIVGPGQYLAPSQVRRVRLVAQAGGHRAAADITVIAPPVDSASALSRDDG